MYGSAKIMPEASPEMTCRERARSSQFFYGNISLKMRVKHLLGSKLLPRFQAAPGWDCELWGAAMRLQGICAKYGGGLIERQPIKRFAVFYRGENAFCYFRDNHILDKKNFLKSE